MLIGVFHRFRPTWIDDHHRRSPFPSSLQKWEHVDVGDDGVTPPEQDRSAVQEVLRGVAAHRPIALELAGHSGPRAKAADSLGDAAPEVEKAVVERLQQPHGAGALVVEDRQRAVLQLQGRQPFRQGIERFIPGDTGPPTLGALEWMEDAVGAIDTRRVPVGLLAEEAACGGVGGVALQFDHTSVPHMGYNGTGVGAVASAGRP
jgi:hypothetical protein